MAKLRQDRSPFDVILISNRSLPGNGGIRQFVFDVRANRQVQRYTINASNYDVATDVLAKTVQANIYNAGDRAAYTPSAYYSEDGSRRVAGTVIASIVVATIAAQWVAGTVLRWLASRKEEG